MKKMKNLLLGLFVLFAIGASAQFKYSAGAELALPFEDGFGVGFGVTVGAEYELEDNMGITGQVGYIMLTNDVEGVSSSIIPIQAGFKYYLEDNTSGIYLHGQAGFHTMKVTVEFLGQEISASSTNLSLAFGGGYMVTENIDLGLRYNMILGADGVDGESSSFGYVAARIAYVF